MKKICEECSNEFEVNPKHKRSRNKRFCSGLCAKRNTGKKNKGRKYSNEVNKSKGRVGELNHFYEKKHTAETINKIIKVHKGRKYSDEVNKKKGRAGELNHFYGKKHTAKTKALISETHWDTSGKNNPMYGKGHKISGEKNGGWYGGISEDPYGLEFSRTLRNQIRERDNFECAICKKKGYDVHHIDYDKMNNLSENLITLCHSDHMKTNFNRESWEKYFKNYILNEYG